MPLLPAAVTQSSRSAFGLLPTLTALQAAEGPELPPGTGSEGRSRICSIFNPVPPDQMRPMPPDRPDKTESPDTVDAGLTRGVKAPWSLDVGFSFGVTLDARDFNPFPGISRRF